MLEGIYVANVTPFAPGPGHALDVRAYLEHVSWLATTGVDGVVPFGTNGEGPSATVAEKRQVVEELVALRLPLQLVPAVAEGNLPDSLSQLEHLNDLDVRAVLVLPPYYFKPVEEAGLRAFYERVLEVSRHPVVVYHIPKYAVGVPASLVTSLPVWGVKDSSGEAGYAEQVAAGGRGVLLGTEDDLPGRLGVAAGAISALSNIVPEQVVELVRCVRAGETERARELSAHLQTVRALTKEHDSPAVLKALAGARNGAAMGTVRPPLMPLPSDYDLETAVSRLGLPPA